MSEVGEFFRSLHPNPEKRVDLNEMNKPDNSPGLAPAPTGGTIEEWSLHRPVSDRGSHPPRAIGLYGAGCELAEAWPAPGIP